jgi:hypothetical protein
VKGVALLIVNHPDRASDQWMWTPAIERDRRIALQDRSTRFFGTDFSFEDLEERDVNQYDYQMLGDETVDGARAGRFQSVPKERKSSQYTRSVVWIRKDNYAFARIESYVKDAVVRRLDYSDIQNVQGSGRRAVGDDGSAPRQPHPPDARQAAIQHADERRGFHAPGPAAAMRRSAVLATAILLACAAPAGAQSITSRGFVEGRLFVFPQAADLDRQHFIVDLLARGELAARPLTGCGCRAASSSAPTTRPGRRLVAAGHP